LEGIVKLLVRDGLLRGLRGKGGGYRLTRPPEAYPVEEILRLTEEALTPVACLERGAPVCPRAAECRTLPMWRGLNQVIHDYLGHVTLADLMRRETGGNDYVI